MIYYKNMPTKTTEQAKILTLQQLKTMRYPLPQSWLNVAGILKGGKKVNALVYQKRIRKGWGKRLAKLEHLAK
jgi:hypothetical protein